MGQAKKRGSQEARITAALARQDELKPTELMCNECKGIIPAEHIYMQDTRNMEGMEMACSGICPDCKSVTWGFNGTDAAVLALRELIVKENPDSIGSVQQYARRG